MKNPCPTIYTYQKEWRVYADEMEMADAEILKYFRASREGGFAGLMSKTLHRHSMVMEAQLFDNCFFECLTSPRLAEES